MLFCNSLHANRSTLFLSSINQMMTTGIYYCHINSTEMMMMMMIIGRRKNLQRINQLQMRCFPLLHIYIINPRGYYELMKRTHTYIYTDMCIYTPFFFRLFSYSYFSFAKAISFYSSYTQKSSVRFSFRTGYAVQHASELRRKTIVAIKFTHVCVCCPLSPDVSLTD